MKMSQDKSKLIILTRDGNFSMKNNLVNPLSLFVKTAHLKVLMMRTNK